MGKNGCFEVSLGEVLGFETRLCGTLVVWELVEPWVSVRAGWLTPVGVPSVVLLEPGSKVCGMLVTGEKWGGLECGRVDGSM